MTDSPVGGDAHDHGSIYLLFHLGMAIFGLCASFVLIVGTVQWFTGHSLMLPVVSGKTYGIAAMVFAASFAAIQPAIRSEMEENDG